MLELRKVFMWVITDPALHLLCISHIKMLSRKCDMSSWLRGWIILMKESDFLPDSTDPEEPEMSERENEYQDAYHPQRH